MSSSWWPFSSNKNPRLDDEALSTDSDVPESNPANLAEIKTALLAAKLRNDEAEEITQRLSKQGYDNLERIKDLTRKP